MMSYTSEPIVNMKKEDIKYPNNKIKRKNKQLDGKNHFVAIFEPKNSKNKDVSNSEN